MFKRNNFVDFDILRCKTNNSFMVQRVSPEFSVRAKVSPKNRKFKFFTSTISNEGLYTAKFTQNGTVSTLEPKLNENLKVILKIIQSSTLLCEFFMAQKFDILNGHGRLIAEYKECQPNIEFEYTRTFGNNNFLRLADGKALSGTIAHFGDTFSYGFNFFANKFALNLHVKKDFFDFFSTLHFSTSFFLPKLVSNLSFIIPENSSDSPNLSRIKNSLAFNLKTKIWLEDLGCEDSNLYLKRNNFDGKLLVTYKHNNFTAFTALKAGFYCDFKPTLGVKLNLKDNSKAICALSYSESQKFRYTFGYYW